MDWCLSVCLALQSDYSRRNGKYLRGVGGRNSISILLILMTRMYHFDRSRYITLVPFLHSVFTDEASNGTWLWEIADYSRLNNGACSKIRFISGHHQNYAIPIFYSLPFIWSGTFKANLMIILSNRRRLFDLPTFDGHERAFYPIQRYGVSSSSSLSSHILINSVWDRLLMDLVELYCRFWLIINQRKIK